MNQCMDPFHSHAPHGAALRTIPPALVMALCAAWLMFSPARAQMPPAREPPAAAPPSAELTSSAVITSAPFDPSAESFYLPITSRRGEPIGPYPADQSMFTSINTNLTWDADSIDGATWTVYMGQSYPPETVVAEDLTAKGYNPPELLMDTRYYWRVAATLASGGRLYGPVWTFKTEWPVSTPDVNSMVLVPGGSFLMGCDRTNPHEHVCSWNDTHYDEPVRSIQVDTFSIDTYEVTNSEYRKCYQEGKCQRPRKEQQFNDPAYALAPVTYVSWYDAQDFCHWEGKRLPTEAEWEKAGRGTLDTRVYPWGDEEPDCHRINMRDVMPGCEEGRDPGVVRVGLYPTGVSPFGAHDMAGNVFEWVQDKYDVWYYTYGPTVNPQGPPYSRWWRGFASAGSPPPYDQDGYPVYVVRGGSWAFSLDYTRVSHRHWGHHGDVAGGDIPLHRNGRVGFRCAFSETK